MMFWVAYSIVLFVFSTILALLEIQIEGRNGWAAQLPCWRPKENSRADRLYRKLLGTNKPLTGYHIAINSLVIFVLHSPFLRIGWTIAEELAVISTYLLVTIFWDFLWFVWNPNYGPKRFNSRNEDIWWMRKWFWGVIPTDYPKGIVAALAIAGIASFVGHSSVYVARWTTTLGIMTCLTLVSCLFPKKGQE